MARPASKRPTDAELEILNVLWDEGRSTVREVYRAVLKRRTTGYTSVLKLMQIMTRKGMLTRDESVRPQIYRVAKTQAQTQKQLVADLLRRAFDNAPGNLVLQALSSATTTPEERRKIQELLDRHRGYESNGDDSAAEGLIDATDGDDKRDGLEGESP
jgi:predicted transcriptional regulator